MFSPLSMRPPPLSLPLTSSHHSFRRPSRDFDKNEYELKKALLADGVTPVEDAENGVLWAGYDSPFVYVNRHNEVWVRVA